MPTDKQVIAKPTKVSLKHDLDDFEKESSKKLAKQKRKLMQEKDGDEEKQEPTEILDHLEKYAIQGDEKNWSEALNTDENGLVSGSILSVKRTDGEKSKKKHTLESLTQEQRGKTNKKHGGKKFKK